MNRFIPFLAVILLLTGIESKAAEKPVDIIKRILRTEAKGQEKKADQNPGSENGKKRKQSSSLKKESVTKKKSETVQAPSPDEIILKTGIKLYNSSLHDAALKKINELRSRFPRSQFRDAAALWAGRIKLELRKEDEAIKEFKAIPENSGEFPSALFYIGTAFLRKGQQVEAIQSFFRLSTQFPDYELADNALIRLAMIYLARGKGNEALESAIRVIRYYPDRETMDDAYYLIGRIFLIDATLRDIEVSRKIFKIFLRKANNGEKQFADSPLKKRVQRDLSYIERTYFPMEN